MGKEGLLLAKLLSIQNINVFYGDVQVIWDVSLKVYEGEVVALFGGNGVGKTTTLRTISGLVKPKTGCIYFAGQEVSRMGTHRLAELGLAHVPEGRHVFPQMTVQENLEMGAYPARVRSRRKEMMAGVYALFPVLKDRRKSIAGTLSGGQQQMLAIGRGLMAEPKLLMLDEPSLGLAPNLVFTLFETIRKIKELGVTVLLVEQNVYESMEVADRYYLLETGRIVSSGVPAQLQGNPVFRQAYLGI